MHKLFKIIAVIFMLAGFAANSAGAAWELFSPDVPWGAFADDVVTDYVPVNSKSRVTKNGLQLTHVTNVGECVGKLFYTVRFFDFAGSKSSPGLYKIENSIHSESGFFELEDFGAVEACFMAKISAQMQNSPQNFTYYKVEDAETFEDIVIWKRVRHFWFSDTTFMEFIVSWDAGDACSGPSGMLAFSIYDVNHTLFAEKRERLLKSGNLPVLEALLKGQ